MSGTRNQKETMPQIGTADVANWLRTLSLASLSAPASSSSRAQSARPFSAAQLSAVTPPCEHVSQYTVAAMPPPQTIANTHISTPAHTSTQHTTRPAMDSLRYALNHGADNHTSFKRRYTARIQRLSTVQGMYNSRQSLPNATHAIVSTYTTSSMKKTIRKPN